jgi:microcystin-dependent protein
MSEPFLSEIKIMSFAFAPKGWAQCNGQLLPINQNQALFSLLGTTYGGDGRVNFALPDLRARVPVGFGTTVVLGERGGEAAHTVIIGEMAAHNHSLNADPNTAGASNSNTPAPAGSRVMGQSAGAGGNPVVPYAVNLYNTGAPNNILAIQSITANGSSQAHVNQQPYLVLNFCIALQGIFPSRN